MNEDKKLTVLAAKAIGMEHPGGDHSIHDDGRLWDCKRLCWWNPLHDDGDALRLAVKLRIDFTWQPAMESVIAYPTMHDTLEITEEYMEYSDNGIPVDTYRYSALRRAIVRAAAEIGKAMP